MPRSLVSDWKRVATSGKTADGRTIAAQDLRDMAENYDPALYTATIWYEHIRYFGSLGTVAELKAEDVDGGKVALYARLQPNDTLLRLNKEGQKLFASVEIQPNFADTGKAYLSGMAVTDEPASVGTEALHFSRRAGAGNHFGNLEPLGDLNAQDDDEAAAMSFFTRMFKAIGVGPAATPASPATHNSESTPMDQKTVEAFASAVEKLGTVATSLEQSAAKFAAQAPSGTGTTTTQPATTAEGNQPAASGTEQQPAAGVSAEQFAALQGAVEKLTEQFSSALNHGKGKDVPATTGAASDQQEAVY
ncbi:GPO family capsid scaffolding protein [Pseudomonas sp. A-1]|uniref:GPO family capsid scaffolding protein n=1 Tax=Pseudomonas sp. A-1 TaxID=1821274 RepID=UPI00145584EC|nr:GPO family capsid scaffolding protein [Pseudomonas sp. A-1]